MHQSIIQSILYTNKICDYVWLRCKGVNVCERNWRCFQGKYFETWVKKECISNTNSMQIVTVKYAYRIKPSHIYFFCICPHVITLNLLFLPAQVVGDHYTCRATLYCSNKCICISMWNYAFKGTQCCLLQFVFVCWCGIILSQ